MGFCAIARGGVIYDIIKLLWLRREKIKLQGRMLPA